MTKANATVLPQITSTVEAGARGGARTRELIEKGKLYEQMELAAAEKQHAVEHAPPTLPTAPRKAGRK